MKTVREELAEALRRYMTGRGHRDDCHRLCCYCGYAGVDAAIARHAAEPDDRPLLLAFLRAYRMSASVMADLADDNGRSTMEEYFEAEAALREARNACADIATEDDA